jgi:peptidyl-tRNA hydrolase
MVHDGGFTEVAPGSLTVVAELPRPTGDGGRQ